VVQQVLLVLQALFLILLYLFVWNVVRTGSRDLAAQTQESFVLAPQQAAAAGFAVEAPAPPGRLVVLASPALVVGASLEVGAVPLTVGRAGDNAVALAEDDFASSHHARLESLRDGVWLVDLGSTNGTYVNGERVEGRRRLAEGDVVRIGATDLRLEPGRARHGGAGPVAES
jgi:pSer/pThr/pTyr-binding forkhead associated (FHA) protein